MYFLTVKYTSDSERKRIEYVLEKWRGKMNITKPEGITAIAAKGDIDELILDLYSRTEKDNVALYKIERTELDVVQGEKNFRLKLGEKRETLEKLLDFIMARQKAILKLELAEPHEKVYEVYTKKGKAEISIGIHEGETGTDLLVRISGYGEAVDFLYHKLAEELKLLEG